MRQFSTNVQQALSQEFVEYFFLVELNLNNNYYLTTHSTNLTVDGDVYTGNGAIFSYEPPSKNSVVDREAYSISFVDPNHSLLQEAVTGIVGKSVSIRAGFIHETLGPLTNTADLVYVYTGFVDTPTIKNDFNSKILTIDCSSPMADLDAVRSYFTTKYGVSQFDSADSCFDRIHDGYDLQLKWGKV